MTESLHTKYRPRTLDEVIGHGSIVRALDAAIEKRTSQTFLFHGAAGIGKTTLARIAAGLAGSANESDFLEIDAATYNGIDDIRSITSGLMYRPFGEKSVKSIIVDECHALTAQSWKALLKSLEEPPAHVFWFLCTTDPGKIPPNIKTRCTTFELKPVSSKALFELLVDIAKREKIFAKGEGEDIIDVCVQEAQGSPRQALVNLGTCIDARDGNEAAKLLQSAAKSSEVKDLCQALTKRASWSQIQKILASLKDTDAESVRRAVQGYMTTVALNAKTDAQASSAVEILDAFSEPFYFASGLTPVVLACGRICFSE